jgi:molybdate transport system substrate-binding protein
MLAAAAATAVLVVSGCDGSDGDGNRPRLIVSAAASLTEALTACSRDFPDGQVRLSFGGSDELAAQIRQGVKPDVYAAANTTLPDELGKEGRLDETIVFATNELVLAAPSASKKVTSLNDLAESGLELAIGSDSVPVGSYTREVLSRLPVHERDAILRTVRSEEPDVKGVVGKLTQGAVDAGFVYKSDVEATKGKLRAIELPERLGPTVAYGAGVVTGARQPEAAREYVDGLVSGVCADALRKAGFGPPPSS